MKTHFYSHIVETSSISLALGEMDLTPEERKHLITLVEENLHHAILDAVLSELSDKDKQEFLDLLAKDENEKVWKLLADRVDHIEDKIKKTADDLKDEIHKDIEDSHKNLPISLKQYAIITQVEQLKPSKKVLFLGVVILILAFGLARFAISKSNHSSWLLSSQIKPIPHGEDDMEAKEEEEEEAVNNNQTNYDLAITSEGFSKTKMTIKVFDTITLTNKDTLDHEITADKPTTYGKIAYDSGVLKPGMFSIIAFKKKGSVIYQIKDNPNQKLTVSAF